MKRKFAVLAAMAMCVSSVPMTYVSAIDFMPVAGVVKSSIPSWIPETFADAMSFYNEYGVTHVSNGNNGFDVACLVFPESTSSSAKYEIRTTESVNNIYHDTFTSPIGDTKYEVVAYYDDCKSPTSFSVDLNCNDEIQWSYVFDCDGSGNLTETDLYSWVPDCYSEYTTFIETNGNTLVKDKYICFCDDVNYSTGADISMEQSGTAEIKEVQNFNVSKSDEAVEGNTDHTVRLYEAVTPGTVDVTIYKGRTWDPNAPKEEMLSETYTVEENLTITPTKKTDVIKGDVNADGNFTVADVVMLQKWLLATSDVKLADWKAADLCEDGVLNVFDLCMMKRELIGNTDNKPILTKAELRDIILSKEEYTWSDFEQYQSEDIGSGVYVLKYKVDFDGEDIEVNLYITGSDLEKKPEKIYIDVNRSGEEEKLDIYEFRQQLMDFIDSFNKQEMTMDDVIELSNKGDNLTWSDFDNYEHSEDVGSGLTIYEFKIANYSDRFTLVVGYSDENSLQYVRLKSSGSTIDITESSENDIMMFIAKYNPPA